MVNGIFKTQKLEELLQHNWGNFLDHLLLMRKVMEDVRDTSFKEIKQQNIPPRQVKFSVTKFNVIEKSKNEASFPNYAFEFWLEFTIPKDNGVVIGTNTYLMNLQGEIQLDKSFGTHFKPEDS
jgi:hypothetical protein